MLSNQCVLNSPATIRPNKRLPRALCQRGRQKRTKNTTVVEKVTNVHQVNVNVTHVCEMYEKIEVPQYVRFAAQRLILFL